MSSNNSLSERLRFNLIDQETMAALREAKTFVLGELPGVLDAFYDHIGKFSDTAKFFKSRDHMMHAKKMQIQHWSVILDARFDDTYSASVTKIGEVHNKLGLEPRWYIGGYNALAAGLVHAIATKMPFGRFDSSAKKKRAAFQTAIIKAAMLDMDLAISVYVEGGRRERREMLDRPPWISNEPWAAWLGSWRRPPPNCRPRRRCSPLRRARRRRSRRWSITHRAKRRRACRRSQWRRKNSPARSARFPVRSMNPRGLQVPPCAMRMKPR